MGDTSHIVPRLLSRKTAALYLSVSPTTLDTLITDGIVPGPVRLRGRVLWDRHKLDEAIDALSGAGQDEGPETNDWD